MNRYIYYSYLPSSNNDQNITYYVHLFSRTRIDVKHSSVVNNENANISKMEPKTLFHPIYSDLNNSSTTKLAYFILILIKGFSAFASYFK